MATIDYVGDNGPDGVVIGKAATDLVSFHGATPCDQAAAVTLATGATAATIVTAFQDVLTALREKGLIAT
jgi:hypothetical protein